MHRLRARHDILLRLQFSWTIFRAVHVLLKRPTMGGEEWDGMERGDKEREGKHKMKNEIIGESKNFKFDDCGRVRNACARYYQNGDTDIEVLDLDALGSAYDNAWIAAEKLGLIK